MEKEEKSWVVITRSCGFYFLTIVYSKKRPALEILPSGDKVMLVNELQESDREIVKELKEKTKDRLLGEKDWLLLKKLFSEGIET